ncbi:uncharacterized protein [Amphiura filiformis]|uniref:uncharacterized protein n=1 Tax=Amphiura filiformis TaxID=82378 RepID=UPI003B20C9C6
MRPFCYNRDLFNRVCKGVINNCFTKGSQSKNHYQVNIRGCRGGTHKKRKIQQVLNPRKDIHLQNNFARTVNKSNLLQIPLLSSNEIRKKCCTRLASWNTRSMQKKATHVCDLIISEKLDILSVTEAWLTGYDRDNHVLADIKVTLPDYEVHCAPRIARSGGGLCIVYRKGFQVREYTSAKFQSFECLDLLITSTNQSSFRLLTIYRPPRSKANPITMTQFFSDFSLLLEDLSAYSGKFAVVGDFNIHVDDLKDSDATTMLNILMSADLVQHIKGSTHKHGHTLDLIISRECDDSVSDPFTVHGLKSDHSAVCCTINVFQPQPGKRVIRSRKLRDINRVVMQNDIKSSSLFNDHEDRDLSALVKTYDSVLHDAFDKHAPECEREISLRPHAPWYDDSLRASKREKRRLERKWIKSGLTIDKQIFHSFCSDYRTSLESAKRVYYNTKLSNCNQRELFRTVDKLTTAKPAKTLPDSNSLQSLTRQFQDFFDSKVDNIRSQLVTSDPGTMSVDVSDSCTTESGN